MNSKSIFIPQRSHISKNISISGRKIRIIRQENRLLDPSTKSTPCWWRHICCAFIRQTFRALLSKSACPCPVGGKKIFEPVWGAPFDKNIALSGPIFLFRRDQCGRFTVRLKILGGRYLIRWEKRIKYEKINFKIPILPSRLWMHLNPVLSHTPQHCILASYGVCIAEGRSREGVNRLPEMNLFQVHKCSS